MCATRFAPVEALATGGPWRDFVGNEWRQYPDVRSFIQANYMPYGGDHDFLAGPTARTTALLEKVAALLQEEQARGGVLDVDTSRVAGIDAYPPGYIDQDQELIVGLQTDGPLKRPMNPYGGIRMARQACEAYGYTLDPQIEDIFTRYAPTHNDGVFRAYNEAMLKARKSGVITGLPDAYGRGRIIGDYRRVALYGVDQLIAWRKADKAALASSYISEAAIREAEEMALQVQALEALARMAESYGCDIRRPATNAREAIQWLYFAYLGAVKEQNGAAMSLGRVSTFLDIYLERDLEEGTLDESAAQELIDDFVIKLRIVRQLRTPEYNDLFAGDPTWVTECVGGMGEDGRPLVSRSSYRFLNTLYNLNPAPEPNITVLWDERLPEPFKAFCAQVSIDTASIQYENDALMRPLHGDDYGIACCVSAMTLGKQMQFFGARANLPKTLLMALNGGRDEVSGMQVGPEMAPLPPGVLDYDTVRKRFESYMEWLCGLYVGTMNVIHFMHDKYCYEKLQMSLHDPEVERLMAFGIAGLSVTTDSLSAIKHARVTAHADERGLLTEFSVEGDYPAFGNDDDRADAIAVELVERFHHHLRQYPAYRGAVHTVSILTITSNVVYGKKTGSTPDGRKKGEPFAPGANPMHNRDACGGLASLNSVAKLPYTHCRDGISCTFSITPQTLGADREDRIENLRTVLDGYFGQEGHHINVNVLNRDQLIDAMEHPEKYPNLTIRVSGYAVNFNRLSREHQKEVIERTFHQQL